MPRTIPQLAVAWRCGALGVVPALLLSVSCARFGYDMWDAAGSTDGSSLDIDDAGVAGDATSAEAGGAGSPAVISGAGEAGTSGGAGGVDDGAGGSTSSSSTGAAAGDAGIAGSSAGSAAGGASGGAAAGGGTSSAGAGAGAGTCASFGPFGPPELLTGFGIDAVWSPSFSADGSMLVFADNDPPDIYLSTRSGNGGVFSVATPVSELDTLDAEVTPFLSFDGLSMYFATTQNGVVGTRDIVVATRSALDQPFGPPTPIAELNSSSRDNLPRLTDDELTIMFTSERPGGLGGEDIWMSTRTTVNEPFATPTNVTELNTNGHDGAAVLSRDRLTIFFGSTRPGLFGDRDIWFATRQTVDSPFEAPQKLTEVNSTFLDTDPAISWDGTELVFSSARGGSQQLWRSVRSCQD